MEEDKKRLEEILNVPDSSESSINEERINIPESLRFNADIRENLGVTPDENPQQRKKQIYHQLIQLGFNPASTKVLFLVYQITDLTEALDLLTKSEIGWLHPFVTSGDDLDTCSICGENFGEHVDQARVSRRREITNSIQKMSFLDSFQDSSESNFLNDNKVDISKSNTSKIN